MRPRIVHVTADFPDPIAPDKTAAIRRLVDLTRDRFDHRVISLNRRSPGAGAWLAGLGKPELAIEATSFEHGEAMTYAAPGAGLWHATMLEELGDALADRVLATGERPDLLVGHKLTIEGFVVSRMAERIGVPFALSLQGNTDARILTVRPDLGRRLRRIWNKAAVAFPFTPWALDRIETALGPRPGPTMLLPCATPADALLPPTTGGNGLLTAFQLRLAHTKGFDRLARAHRMVQEELGTVPLAVVGGGDSEATERCRQIAATSLGIRLEGPIEHERMGARLNTAIAFVMPSRRESFGMVFIEALFAGLPVIYPAGQAIDGYFDGAPFAIRVDGRSPRAISTAMAHAVRHEADLKAALAEWQAGPGSARFTQSSIAKTFTSGLTSALTPS